MIPKPNPLPKTIYKGLDSLWALTHMTSNEYTVFLNVIRDAADQYLDLRKYYTQQDEDDLEAHYAEVLTDYCPRA